MASASKRSSSSVSSSSKTQDQRDTGTARHNDCARVSGSHLQPSQGERAILRPGDVSRLQRCAGQQRRPRFGTHAQALEVLIDPSCAVSAKLLARVEERRSSACRTCSRSSTDHTSRAGKVDGGNARQRDRRRARAVAPRRIAEQRRQVSRLGERCQGFSTNGASISASRSTSLAMIGSSRSKLTWPLSSQVPTWRSTIFGMRCLGS